jgi:hypothetical protein
VPRAANSGRTAAFACYLNGLIPKARLYGTQLIHGQVEMPGVLLWLHFDNHSDCIAATKAETGKSSAKASLVQRGE